MNEFNRIIVSLIFGIFIIMIPITASGQSQSNQKGTLPRSFEKVHLGMSLAELKKVEKHLNCSRDRTECFRYHYTKDTDNLEVKNIKYDLDLYKKTVYIITITFSGLFFLNHGISRGEFVDEAFFKYDKPSEEKHVPLIRDIIGHTFKWEDNLTSYSIFYFEGHNIQTNEKITDLSIMIYDKTRE